MNTQVKKPVYDTEADIELPAPRVESERGDLEVDDEEDLDEEECAAVKAVIGFDPRELEDTRDQA